MRRLIAIAIVTFAAALGSPAGADVLIGVAGPMTGKDAWPGEQMQRGAELAVADINDAGGVLGQPVRLITADDACDPDQAVAAAQKLVSHEAAGVLQISPASSNPMLTELGRANVFRVIAPDDADGIVAGDYLADHWAGKKIAILHDGTAFGKGLADATRKQLNSRGATETIYEAYVPGKGDYAAETAKLQAADIVVLYVGGYHTEIALLASAALGSGYPLQLVAGATLATEEFGLIAGPAAEGTRFTFFADPRQNSEAATVVERFRAAGFEPEGYTLFTYAAIQAWSQAAEKSGSLELRAMITSLREQQFDTVLGSIDFDEKGDVTTQAPIW